MSAGNLGSLSLLPHEIVHVVAHHLTVSNLSRLFRTNHAFQALLYATLHDEKRQQEAALVLVSRVLATWIDMAAGFDESDIVSLYYVKSLGCPFPAELYARWSIHYVPGCAKAQVKCVDVEKGLRLGLGTLVG